MKRHSLMTLNCQWATNADLPTPQHDLRGVAAGQPGDAAAGMRTRATQENIVYGHPVRRMARYGAHGIKLIKLKCTMKDIAPNHAEITLDIERRLDLAT